MANVSTSVDYWREFFGNSNLDIFDVIQNGIIVAATDFPHELKLKRDRIAELLFTCNNNSTTLCFACEINELFLPAVDVVNVNVDNINEEDQNKSGVESGESKTNKEIEYSNAEVEALSNEMEESCMVFEEILRLKNIIDNTKDEALLLDSLKKLQQMPMTVDTLKSTDIGISVNLFRKHESNEIRVLVKTLIGYWKFLVDEWVTATKSLSAETEKESSKRNVDEEGEVGLPSPPLDGDFLFATPTTSMEFSNFFDGMDDDIDANPRKNQNIGRKSNIANIPKFGDQPKVEPSRSQEEAILNEAPLRKPKPVLQPKSTDNVIKVQKNTDQGTIQRNPIKTPPLACNDDVSTEKKIETSTKKFKERYLEAENAKKRRSIQIVDFEDVPKMDVPTKKLKKQTKKPVNMSNKNRPNGRRLSVYI